LNPLILEVNRQDLKKQIPVFRAGDSVRVAVRIVEGDKERIQNFEGVCIARHGAGMDETFTVRRVSYGVGMERIFMLHSPRVESVTVLRQGHSRRSKLYYLRDLTGKKARLPETRRKRQPKDAMEDVAAAIAPAATTTSQAEPEPAAAPEAAPEAEASPETDGES